MNADRLEGTFRRIKGWAMQVFGRLTGDRALVARGRAAAFSGAAQASLGRAMGAGRLLGFRRLFGV